jgi:hypothetical protein
MTKTTYPLRLPVSLRAEVEELSKQDGTSINQFVVMAVAEKVASMSTAAFFEDRRQRGDLALLRKVLTRKGGEPPRAGDELPAEPKRRKR